MKQKIKSLISLKTTSAFFSLLFFVALAGGMAINAPSASAVDTISSSVYLDTDDNGTVDTIRWTMDENVTVCTHEAGDWTINTAGTIGVTAITGLTCTGSNAILDISITASANITGGGTAPVISYANVGAAGSVTLTSGAMSAKANQSITDGAGPAIVSAVSTTTTTLTVTFSENILDTSLATTDFTLDFTDVLADGNPASFATGTADDSVITLTVAGGAIGVAETTGTVALSGAGVITELAGTGNTSAQTAAVTVADGIAPTLTSAIFTDTALKVGETSLVTFTFSEAITGFTNADLTIVNGTLTTVTDAGAGTIWTATFTPTDDLEDATNVIAVDLTGVADTATNAGVGSTNSSNCAIDTKEPTAAITYSDSNITSGESLTITATFSEAMADSPVMKIALSGANTVSATNMTKATTTSYTYTYTVASGSGTVTVALSIGTDVATNVITSTPTSGATFTTANAGGGMVSPVPISTTGQAAATPAYGGVISKTNIDGTSAKVVLPAGALIVNTVITINPTVKAEAVVSHPVPVANSMIGDYAYNFTAVSGLNTAVNAFEKALALTFTYTDKQAEEVNEGDLKIYYWDNTLSEWVVLADSEVDTAGNVVTATTAHFTYFAILGGQSSEIVDGDIIQCQSSDNPFAVYIVKVVGDTKYIRHIVSLEIFNYYGHLKWENLKQVDSLDSYSLSGWARVNTGPDGTAGPNDKVYEINADQTKHWINMTAEDFLTHGGSEPAIYNINQGELNLYTTGVDVMSL